MTYFKTKRKNGLQLKRMLKSRTLKIIVVLSRIYKGDSCRIKTPAYNFGQDVSICDQLNFV